MVARDKKLNILARYTNVIKDRAQGDFSVISKSGVNWRTAANGFDINDVYSDGMGIAMGSTIKNIKSITNLKKKTTN